MSIASKLTYLNNTKQLLKDGINDLGGNIDSETTFREYVSNLTEIYNDYPKVSDTGTEINLTNTKQGKITNELNPTETSQESTTGKNKLPYTNDINETIYSTKITGIKGIYTIQTTPTATVYQPYVNLVENYTIQSGDYLHIMNDVASSNVTFNLKTTDDTILSPILNSVNRIFDLSSFVGKTISSIRFYVSTSYDGTKITLTPMIINSSTATSYEPYTGGIPAPNPDYPFPIHTVSGENNIKIENKNLFDYNKATQVVNNVNFVINEDKSIIANGTASSNTYWKLGELYLPKDGIYYISGSPSDGSSSTYRVTCYLHDENGTYISAYSDTGTGISFSGNKGYRLDYYIYIANGVTITNKVFKPMVEQGSTATEYTPHQEQNYVINLGGLEYCKIVDYKNQIFKNIINSPYYDNTLNENEWYMKKNIGKAVLDGSETNWTDRPNYNAADRFIIDNFFPTNDKNILSNYFTKVTAVTNTYPYIINNGTQLLINFSEKGTTTLEQFKTWLSTHNTEVVYPLATPQYINITENYPTLATQLENLSNNAKSYNDETNISQTNNDLPFDLNIKALMKGE